MEAIINLIAATTAEKNLNLECCLDDEELKNMNMIVEKFHGECNYTMKPNENRKIA